MRRRERGSDRLAWIALGAALTMGGAAGAQNVPIATPLPIDVPAVSAWGEFRLDGVAMPSSTGDFSFLLLEDERGTATPVGASFLQSYGPSWLIPGEYQRRYGFEYSATSTLPQNPGDDVGAPLLIGADGAIDFDVESVDVDFTFQLDGQAFPTAAGEVAFFSLRDRDTGEITLIGAGHIPSPGARVTPGRYDVIYQYGSGTLLPRNTAAVVAEDVQITRPGQLVVDVPTAMPILAPALNGESFPASAYERGLIRLVDFGTGDSVDVGETNEGALPVRVVPGTYDITYSRVLGNLIVPMNSNAIVAEDVSIQAPANPGQLVVVPFDVEAHEVHHALTMNGGAFPASGYEYGDVVLVGAHGDEVDLGGTHEATPPERWVTTGTYDVHYRRVLGGSLAPRNGDARVATGIRVTSPGAIAIDVSVIEIEIDAELDGAPFPASNYETAALYLEGETPGDVLEIGYTHDLPTSIRLVAGDYDLFYDFGTGNLIVPHNRMQRVASDLEFLTNRAEVVAIESRVLAPSFSLNGAPFPTVGGDRGEIRLRGPAGGSLSLGETDVANPPSVIAIEMDYAIEYSWIDGDSVPINLEKRIGYTSVPEPSFAAGLVLAAVWLAWGAARRPTTAG